MKITAQTPFLLCFVFSAVLAQDCKIGNYTLGGVKITYAPPCRVKIYPSEKGTLATYVADSIGYYLIYSNNTPVSSLDPRGENSEFVVIGGPIKWGDGEIYSEPTYPAFFKLLRERGIVYLGGKAKIKTPTKEIILGTNHTVKMLLACSQSVSALKREGAAWGLGWIPKEIDEINKAKKALIQLLSDKSPEVQLVAVESLKRLGNLELETVIALQKLFIEGTSNDIRDKDGVKNEVSDMAKATVFQIIKQYSHNDTLGVVSKINLLRFDGYYQGPPSGKRSTYFKFYPDGQYIMVKSDNPFPEGGISEVDRKNAFTGKYTIKGRYIEFEVGKSLTDKFKGMVLDEQILRKLESGRFVHFHFIKQ